MQSNEEVRPAKYHRMSKPGRLALQQWRQDWAGFKDSVDEVLNGGAADDGESHRRGSNRALLVLKPECRARRSPRMRSENPSNILPWPRGMAVR